MLKEYPKFTAAAVQAAPEYRDKPVYFDSAATLDNAISQIKEAAANGATLIVFPELHIPGYCHFAIDLTKGPEYTGIWAEYLRHGIEVPSEETDLLCRAARQANANVVIGINERDKKYGGRQYNSLALHQQPGEILGVHRKINITVQELMIHTRGDGGKQPARPRHGLRQDQRPHLRRARPAAAQAVLHRPGHQGQLLLLAGLPGRRRGAALGDAGHDHGHGRHRRLLVRAGGQLHPAGEAAQRLLPQYRLLPEFRR